MIYDIIVLALMVIPAAIGIYRGFFNMFVRLSGWLVALAAGFFLKDTVAKMIEDSPFGAIIRKSIAEKFAASSEAVLTAVEGLPEIIRGGLAASASSATEILAGMFSSLMISIIAFAGVVIAVWLILKILVRPANKRKNGGILNTADKMLGFTFGFIEGMLLVFIFLTGLLAAVNFMELQEAQQVLHGLETSYIAGTLYDNNLLLLITGGLFG